MSLNSFVLAGRLRFPGVFGFYESFQAGEAGVPEAAILFQPGIYGTERLRIELVNAKAAFAVLANQVRAAEKAQVAGDGRAGDGKGAGDLSGRLAAAAQEVENGAASGIGQGLEGGLGGYWPCGSEPRICNRMVTHYV